MVGFTIGEYGLIEFGPELLDDEEETGKLEGCAIDETVSEDQGEVVGLNTLVVIAEAVADDDTAMIHLLAGTKVVEDLEVVIDGEVTDSITLVVLVLIGTKVTTGPGLVLALVDGGDVVVEGITGGAVEQVWSMRHLYCLEL